MSKKGEGGRKALSSGARSVTATSSFSEISIFVCTHEYGKTVFSNNLILERVLKSCIFGNCFHRRRVDEASVAASFLSSTLPQNVDKFLMLICK